MIRLRPGLLVAVPLINHIELGDDNGEPVIEVHTLDGEYWALTAKEIGAPINEATLNSLGAAIDNEWKRLGIGAGYQVALNPRTLGQAKSRDLDEEIPF